TPDKPSRTFAVALGSINRHSKLYGVDPFGVEGVVVPLEIIPNRLRVLPQGQAALKWRKPPNHNSSDGLPGFNPQRRIRRDRVQCLCAAGRGNRLAIETKTLDVDDAGRKRMVFLESVRLPVNESRRDQIVECVVRELVLAVQYISSPKRILLAEFSVHSEGLVVFAG